MTAYARLLSPLDTGKLRLRNRIVMPPMVTCMDAGGGQAHWWYVARALGGTGLIIREATSIRDIAEPAFAAKLKRTIDAVHEAGCAFTAQLYEPGRASDGETIAPSDRDGARAATEAELEEMVKLWAASALNCRSAGCDGVEPHGAHGFFLNRFFSPVHNTRTDAFGGSAERRMELGLRIVRAIRAAVDDGCAVLYRHTPVGEGYGLDESRAFAQALQEAGVDVLDVSPSTSSDTAPRADWAGALKQAVSIPVIAVGGFGLDPDEAERVLAEGRADLIAIGRGLIADRELPMKLSEGKKDSIIRCIVCNEKCFGNLSKGIPIGCTQNPESGQEYLADLARQA